MGYDDYRNGNIPDGEPYANLANAVVAKAADDYMDFKIFRFKYPVRRNTKVYHGEDALAFLKSENLKLYTSVDGTYLIRKLNEAVKEKTDEILLNEMHENYLLQQGITKKGSKKHE